MKNTFQSVLFFGLLSLLIIPSTLFAQSTEGKDFWVTMMRADSDNPTNLSLTISAQKATHVKVENTNTGYAIEFDVTANGIYRLENLDRNDCYVGEDADVEVASNHALHVTSDQPISLIAANYRDKSFDVAAVLPTSAVRSEYRIMCYAPTDHSGGAQGTHFAIVATEDNTVVDYCPTVPTMLINRALERKNNGYTLTPEEQAIANFKVGDTLTTPVLQKGQVYYVWTGNGSDDNYDLSGTKVKARGNKKIAVFNGNPHTNIPNAIRDRDHIYSQAMPIQYWGTQFAIMSSLTTIDGQSGNWERIDKVRVMALTDETVVYMDGDSVTTIKFANNPKGIYEFDFGAKDNMTNYTTPSGIRYFEGASHFIETSCPAAVHQFFTSNRYDHNSGKYCNGDPSELWVNPIEQNIEEITFATFQTQQVKDHFINIVTESANVASMTLDGNSISSRFKALNGNSAYQFARFNITDGTHTLKGDTGFIANVYGFGEKESYAFPAGAHTKDLTSAIIINGDTFSIDKQGLLCGNDIIHFECNLNYVPQAVKWGFGDGTDTTIVNTAGLTSSSVDHFYQKTGSYPAYAIVIREHDNTCYGEADLDSIPIAVTIGRLEFEVGMMEIPCGENAYGRLSYNNISGVDLRGEGVSFGFDGATKAFGFKDEDIDISTPGYFEFPIPTSLSDDDRLTKTFAMNLHIETKCDTLDKTLEFNVPQSSNVIDQRYSYILGLKESAFHGYELTNFQWYHASDSTAIEGQNSSVLNLKDDILRYGADLTFYVCYDVRKKGNTEYETKCSCPGELKINQDQASFESTSLIGSSAPAGSRLFVNAEQDATATWYTIDGSLHSSQDIPAGGGLVQVPAERGLYILRVSADSNRNFKFMVF